MPTFVYRQIQDQCLFLINCLRVRPPIHIKPRSRHSAGHALESWTYIQLTYLYAPVVVIHLSSTPGLISHSTWQITSKDVDSILLQTASKTQTDIQIYQTPSHHTIAQATTNVKHPQSERQSPRRIPPRHDPNLPIPQPIKQ